MQILIPIMYVIQGILSLLGEVPEHQILKCFLIFHLQHIARTKLKSTKVLWMGIGEVSNIPGVLYCVLAFGIGGVSEINL